MPAVTIRLPAILSHVVGENEVAVEAATPGEALRLLTLRHPGLQVLMLDESDRLREHVLCYHNDENTRWHEDGMCRPLGPRDTLTIVQAVAGG